MVVDSDRSIILVLQKRWVFGSIHIEVPTPQPIEKLHISIFPRISKHPFPVPNNWKTKCLGQCMSKFPLPQKLKKKLNVSIYSRTIEKLDDWVNTYPSFPSPYRTIEKLNVWINTYPSSQSSYPTIEKLNVWVYAYPSSPSPFRTLEKLNVWVYKYLSSPPPYRTIEKLKVWVNTYPCSPHPTEQ
jgi:hypothetical protein